MQRYSTNPSGCLESRPAIGVTYPCSRPAHRGPPLASHSAVYAVHLCSWRGEAKKV